MNLKTLHIKDAETSAFAWLDNPALNRLFDLFAKNNEGGDCLRIVGGAVRNGLQGLPVSDIDLATNLRPDELLALAKDKNLKMIETGIAHGTLIVVIDHTPFEITSLRLDVQTDGRHATIAFTDDWAKDAARRDFTMNALYLSRDGMIYDYLGNGIADAQAQKVRFIYDPHKRIEEDRLRILRFFRFSAYYGGGELDQAGLDACTTLKAGLHDLSKERIWQEFQKLLIAPFAGQVLDAMSANEIVQAVLTGRIDVEAFAGMAFHEAHYGLPHDRCRRLAALCPLGGGRSQILKQELRLSNHDAQRLHKFETWINGPKDIPQERFLEDPVMMLGAFGRALALDFYLLSQGVSLSLLDANKSEAFVKALQTHSVPKFPVKGEDLLALGFQPGKQMGDELKRLKQIWLTKGAKGSRENLLDKARP